jgi:hypothetical protein
MAEGDHGDRPRRRIELSVGLLQYAGTIIAIYAGPVLRFPPLAQVSLFLGVTILSLVLAGVIDSDGSPMATIGTVLRRIANVCKSALKWVAFGIPGVILALIAFLLVTGLPFHFRDPPTCAEPIDLRVVTNSEDVVPLTEAAGRYVADKSGQGCRAATITVTGSSSIDELEDGFARGWTSPGSDLNDNDCAHVPARMTLLGPRPDIWIPGSMAVATAVQANVKAQDICPRHAHPARAKADLDIKGSVGSSPVVMGVFASANRTDLGHVPGKQHLASLLSAFRTNHVINSVTRPSADSAESALLSTPALYRALREGGWVGGQKQEAEKRLDQGSIPAGDAASLLCHFRGDDAGGLAPPGDTAVIIPESVLARYDYGDSLGAEATCQSRKPSPEWTLYPYYTDDLPVIEHPFVHVRWPGEDTASRNQAVAEFQQWLEHDALTYEGMRKAAGQIAADGNPRLQSLQSTAQDAAQGAAHAVPEPMSPHALDGDAGCVGSLDQIFGCYNDARPTYPLTVLIDISGSMANGTVASGELRLARAQELAQRIVGRVQPTARISLYLFSSVTQPSTEKAPGSNNDEARKTVLAAIQRAVVNGPDLPLTTAIDQTSARLVRGTQTLVLLTDGQPGSAKPGSADQAGALTRRLEQNQGLQVLVVPTGPGDCRAQPVAALDAALRAAHEGSCVGTPKDTLDDLADAVLSKVLWR